MRRALSELVLVAFPKVAGGALSFALNVALLRFLGPEQFGVYSLCVAAILLSEGIVGTPFDLAVLRLSQGYLKTRPRQSIAIEQAAIWLKLVTISALGIGVVAFSGVISEQVFKLPGTGYLVPVAVLAVVAMLLLRSVLTHVQVRRRFARYGAIDLSHILLKFGGIALLLLLTSPGPGELLGFWIIGPLLAMVGGLLLAARPLVQDFAWRRRDAAEVAAYAKWFLLTTALGATMGKMDIFMLSAYESMYDVGLYSGALVFALIPELLGTYMATVLSPRIVPSCQAGTFRVLFARVQGVLLSGAVVLYLVAWLFWEPVSALLLPDAYRPSGEILLILLPGALAGMATFPLALVFVLFVNKKLLFYMDLASFPILVGCYLLVLPEYGAKGAAWIATGFHLLRTLVVQFIGWRWSRRPDPLGKVLTV